jgi:hypothetical protein
MSMLPELVYEDECNAEYEDAFFKQLHRIDDYSCTEVSEPISTTSATLHPGVLPSFWSRTYRVVGKNYSYPLHLDPIYFQGENYVDKTEDLY